jgi:predicted nucleotidyltransferase
LETKPWEFRPSLASCHIPPHYDEADLDEDVTTLRKMGKQGQMTKAEELVDKLIAWAHVQQDILALYLHGSQAEGQASVLSDIDVAILVREGLSRQQLWQLEDRWVAHWPEFVDIRVLNLAPLPFRYEVTAHGQRLWAADLARVADWESLVWRQYWDLHSRLEYDWEQYVQQVMEQKSETERRQYQTALAKVRAVHRRIREAAGDSADDLTE